jgi:2-oxoglutarate ferredoxin oxidoreductase subunit alpha
MSKVLMKGNEVVGAAAIKAGCKFFFGYPITPQNEIPEYMSKELPKAGGTFVQAESEVAAINMVYGCAGTGARVMTSSSSPGIALKQEGITYIAGAELPCVIVNMMRGGPGLGGIQPSQADYNQCTRGGGNGDYNLIVYAPADLQEMSDLMQEAFEVADYYRNPVMIAGDGMLGQMMEAVDLKVADSGRKLKAKTWATTGTEENRAPNIINTVYLDPVELEDVNTRLQKKYRIMKEEEQKYELYNTENADLVCVAYGTTARIVKDCIKTLKKEGINIGLIRPITLWPYPKKAFDEIDEATKNVLTIEMSEGQMVDDVDIALKGKLPSHFYGRSGGMVPQKVDIINKIKEIIGG